MQEIVVAIIGAVGYIAAAWITSRGNQPSEVRDAKRDQKPSQNQLFVPRLPQALNLKDVWVTLLFLIPSSVAANLFLVKILTGRIREPLLLLLYTISFGVVGMIAYGLTQWQRAVAIWLFAGSAVSLLLAFRMAGHSNFSGQVLCLFLFALEVYFGSLCWQQQRSRS